MPVISFSLFLLMNGFLYLLLYLYVRVNRKKIGFQHAMNATMLIAGLTAFYLGIVLSLQYPNSPEWVFLVAPGTGMLAGAWFGALFDYQTAITGVVHGLMMGLMAPMVGMIWNQPLLLLLIAEGFYLLSLSFVALSVKQT